MPVPDSWIPLIAAFAFGVVATGGMVLLQRSARKPRKPRENRRGGPVEFECTICHRDLIFGSGELVALSAPEKALVVRSRRSLQGQDLAEYVCPYCEAAHCFALHGGRATWVGVNFYEPQTASARCAECGGQLRPPPPSVQSYSGRMGDAPELAPDLGLRCSRCGVVCCVACGQQNTQGPTETGGLVCPRCGRDGLDRFFYFGAS